MNKRLLNEWIVLFIFCRERCTCLFSHLQTTIQTHTCCDESKLNRGKEQLIKPNFKCLIVQKMLNSVLNPNTTCYDE